MNLGIGVRTDVGRVREGNEDSYYVDAPVFVVADGMGGHLAGDVASATAVETVQAKKAEARAQDPDTLAAIIREANRAIWSKAADDPALRGMGTTCTMLLLEDSVGQIAHVGDSRAYLFRGGELSQLTEDHTLVGRMVREGKLEADEAERHPQRSIITRALGVDEDVQVDLLSVEVADGDRLLLCSDGLSSMIRAEQIREVLGSGADAQATADRLVEAALEAGGEDNITVVVVDIGAEGSTAPATTEHHSDAGERMSTDPAADTGYHRAMEVTPARRRWPRILFGTIVVLALLGIAGFFGFRYALDNSWFVGADEAGVVTIYRGIPDDIAGVELSEVHHSSDITVDSLPAFKRDDVRTGIKVETLAEAQMILEDLERIAHDEDFQASVQTEDGG
ncbi:MAG TPA: Stp1/IreP family PP2C-type Ser/Thr phosphatase [Actinomycetota bacterium]|nr:Stp1/IreP family PP2C-type Ser/Thr phosphatase [Actinomycetota bacterium]